MTVLGTTVNIRSDPVVSDDSIVAALEEAAGREFDVFSQPDAGWYRIAADEFEGNWIFGSLIFPQAEDLRVAVTLNGQPAQVVNADGEPLPTVSDRGPFVLVTGEDLNRFEILLADGTYAFVDRQTVALVEDLSMVEDR